MSVVLAEDGQPKINVVDLAHMIVGGNQPLISHREVVALAQAVHDFHPVMELGVALVSDIGNLADKPKSLSQRAAITANLFKFAEGLHHTGYLEASDAKNLLG